VLQDEVVMSSEEERRLGHDSPAVKCGDSVRNVIKSTDKIDDCQKSPSRFGRFVICTVTDNCAADSEDRSSCSSCSINR